MNADSGPIGFAGLSHLGIVYSLATAARGFEVVGFDPRPGLPENLTAGRFPVHEPGIDELFAAHRSRVSYTADLDRLGACLLIFFALDVPTDDHNQSDVTQLERLIEAISGRAASGATLVILSQVPPGFSRRAQRRFSSRVQVFYQVETLIFGNAVERALKPERYMIGCSDPTEALPEMYGRFLRAFGCPLLPMGYESAELCKIAINCFLVSSVSTSNMLAEICEHIGADWSEIVPALRLDRRIGPHAYLSPGLGIAGGNLERDLVTVKNLSAKHGADGRLVTAWQQNSHYRKDWALRLLHQKGLLSQATAKLLGVWGVAYKPDTHATKNSPALALFQALREYRLLTYDPAVKPDTEEFPNVQVCDSALDAARNADALIVMTPWKELSQVPLSQLKQAMRGNHLLDPYGILDGDSCQKLGFDYHRLGA
jgi:UDPglucose 6-dehydrogenase